MSTDPARVEESRIQLESPLGHSEAVAAVHRQLADIPASIGEPMSAHTSFRIGGPADLLVLPTSVEDVGRVVRAIRAVGLPLTIIGNGTNLLVRDGGLRGVVMKVADNLGGIWIDGVALVAQAGAPLGRVSRVAALAGLSGLEFAVGIPGTIGGGVMMNAGAYHGEMKDVVRAVTVIDESGELRTIPAQALEFQYRTSILQRRPWVVVSIAMELCPCIPERALATMAHNQYLRESKQPLNWPSAGSVFKRPPGKYVGPMVEQLGLKGHCVGGAQISTKHAGFIINAGGATASDVLNLIEHVRACVLERFEVRLETEVRVIGEEIAREVG